MQRESESGLPDGCFFTVVNTWLVERRSVQSGLCFVLQARDRGEEAQPSGSSFQGEKKERGGKGERK